MNCHSIGRADPTPTTGDSSSMSVASVASLVTGAWVIAQPCDSRRSRGQGDRMLDRGRDDDLVGPAVDEGRELLACRCDGLMRLTADGDSRSTSAQVPGDDGNRCSVHRGCDPGCGTAIEGDDPVDAGSGHGPGNARRDGGLRLGAGLTPPSGAPRNATGLYPERGRTRAGRRTSKRSSRPRPPWSGQHHVRASFKRPGRPRSVRGVLDGHDRRNRFRCPRSMCDGRCGGQRVHPGVIGRG